MSCPECKSEGLRSRVTEGPTNTTLMYSPPFFDDDEMLHNHNPNTTTTEYYCSNGHEFALSTKKTCWCKMNQEAVAL